MRSARFSWHDVKKESQTGDLMLEGMDKMMDDDEWTLSYPIKCVLVHKHVDYKDWISDEWINEATKEVMYSEGTARIQ